VAHTLLAALAAKSLNRPVRLQLSRAQMYSMVGHQAATVQTIARRREQKKRWFRNGQKWRTGSEGRISVAKRRHGLRRCRYKGYVGMHRWVGLGVIADRQHRPRHGKTGGSLTHHDIIKFVVPPLAPGGFLPCSRY